MDFLEDIFVVEVIVFNFTSPDRAIVAKKQQLVKLFIQIITVYN